MLCKVLIASTYNYLGIHAWSWYLPRWSFPFCEPCPCYNLLHVCSHPRSAQPSISLAYNVSILLVTSCLLSLIYFCCFTTITTTTTSILPLLLIPLCKQELISGVVELTTQLSKPVRILWLPKCRINKLGYSYPRRLLRSPTLVGYQLPHMIEALL